jgi:hypothetical protein
VPLLLTTTSKLHQCQALFAVARAADYMPVTDILSRLVLLDSLDYVLSEALAGVPTENAKVRLTILHDAAEKGAAPTPNVDEVIAQVGEFSQSAGDLLGHAEKFVYIGHNKEMSEKALHAKWEEAGLEPLSQVLERLAVDSDDEMFVDSATLEAMHQERQRAVYKLYDVPSARRDPMSLVTHVFATKPSSAMFKTKYLAILGTCALVHQVPAELELLSSDEEAAYTTLFHHAQLEEDALNDLVKEITESTILPDADTMLMNNAATLASKDRSIIVSAVRCKPKEFGNSLEQRASVLQSVAFVANASDVMVLIKPPPRDGKEPLGQLVVGVGPTVQSFLIGPLRRTALKPTSKTILAVPDLVEYRVAPEVTLDDLVAAVTAQLQRVKQRPA